MNVLSATDRRHHSELHLIQTRPDSPYTPVRRQSTQGSVSAAKSTPSLPSPSIVAARAYHLESTTPIGQIVDVEQRRRSLIEGRFPRRHSILSTTKILAVQLRSFACSAGHHDLQSVPEAEEAVTKVKVEESPDETIEGAKDLDEISPHRESADILCGTPPEFLRQVPFQYTHNHLKDWGYAYLGNLATADAFINAVSLRRPSMDVGMGSERESRMATSLTTIRARIIPNGKDRKPFLIQRQFDIEELRRSITKVPIQPGESESSPVLRRSTRNRRSSTQATTGTPRTESTSTKRKDRSPSLSKGPFPIHIEYALHYLPVLGALMLSGHVRKGDIIDLPIPYPEVWRDVLSYIYTGRGSHGSLTIAMKENILFLAGHA